MCCLRAFSDGISLCGAWDLGYRFGHVGGSFKAAVEAEGFCTYIGDVVESLRTSYYYCIMYDVVVWLETNGSS